MSYVSQGGVVDSITSFVKDVGSGAINVYGESQRQAGAAEVWAQQQQAMMQRPRTPPWLLPAGIGVGALVLIMMLKK